MKVNTIDLMLIFDELMSITDESQGVYWFKTERSDGLVIILAFSVYESYVDIIIKSSSKVDISSLSLNNCSEIRILDEKRKCLEVLHNNGVGRCFLSILGDSILNYEE